MREHEADAGDRDARDDVEDVVVSRPDDDDGDPDRVDHGEQPQDRTAPPEEQDDRGPRCPGEVQGRHGGELVRRDRSAVRRPEARVGHQVAEAGAR